MFYKLWDVLKGDLPRNRAAKNDTVNVHVGIILDTYILLLLVPDFSQTFSNPLALRPQISSINNPLLLSWTL